MKPNAIEQAAVNALAEHGAREDGFRTLRSMLEDKYPGAIGRAKERIERARFEKMFTGSAPDWLKSYVKRHGPRVWSVTARRSKVKAHTSGHCRGRDIVLTFGTDEKQHKLIALHEIAHANAGFGVDGPHGERFYAELRRLLVAENLLRQYGEVIGSKSSLRKAG